MESNSPYSPEAERAVLGTILFDGDLAMQSCIRLRADMFALDSHRRIFAVMVQMLADGSTLDHMTLVEALRRNKSLDSVGGHAYVTDLGSGLPRRFNPAPQVELIIEKWKLRQVQRICNSFGSMAGEPDAAAGEILAEMQADVMDALTEAETQDDPLVKSYAEATINEFLEMAKMHSSQLMGLSYGITKLDAFTEGMKAGEVTVVGARSGVGKSVEMLQAARKNCSDGVPVHLFSLEMTREQCQKILWSMESGVPFKKIRKPSWATVAEIQDVESAARRIAEWPLRIHDKSDMDVNQIAALARLSIRQHGTKLICVDYAQNVEADGRDERTKVSKVSRTLTKLAKDEGAHMMILSQLRKVPPEMYSKPPTVGDLRETGQIENDAHIVLLFHRPWDEQYSRIADSAEILIPKQRSGETGVIQSNFNRNNMMFE